MKQSKLNKEIAAWKIMLDSRNNPQLNSFLVIVFMINTMLFLMVCLKRLCQYKYVFPAYPVCVGLFMMATCNAFFFRMFYNRTSPCFIKTLPFSKAIYTVKISILFETINTLFLLIPVAGSFFCFGSTATTWAGIRTRPSTPPRPSSPSRAGASIPPRPRAS